MPTSDMPMQDTVHFERFRRSCVTVFTMALLASLVACSRHEPAHTAGDVGKGQAQQAIIEDCAAALNRMRANPRFSSMKEHLQHSRAVLIFPHVVRASLVFGGEGGNGIMVVRGPDGSWSNPAFYSVGAPSVGLQVGYRETTIVAFIMDQKTLDRAFEANLTFGSSSGTTLGYVGDNDTSKGSSTLHSVHAMVESGGVYAGLSLDGYVIGPRAKHNLAYYGVAKTPYEILVERQVQRPDARVLLAALGQAPANGSSSERQVQRP